MAMTDTPNAEPPHVDPGGPPATVLRVRGEEHIPPRYFTPSALREIHALLSEGPFDEVLWEITDQQGDHTSTDLDALLNTLLWPSVKLFRINCSRHFLEKGWHLGYRPSVPSNNLQVWTYLDTRVNWSSAPENRQPVEFTFIRLIDLLRRLPASRASRPAFVDSLPEEPTKAWWNPLRSPRSILDWMVIGLLVGLALAAVVAVVALLARTL